MKKKPSIVSVEPTVLPATMTRAHEGTLVPSVPLRSPVPGADPLAVYMREISRYKLLTPEEEHDLTQALAE
jgi:hypothetical protein